MFTLISHLTQGVKNGVQKSIEGVADISSAVARSIQDIITTSFKEGGELISEGMNAAASIVQGAISALTHTGKVTLDSVA